MDGLVRVVGGCDTAAHDFTHDMLQFVGKCYEIEKDHGGWVDLKGVENIGFEKAWLEDPCEGCFWAPDQCAGLEICEFINRG